MLIQNTTSAASPVRFNNENAVKAASPPVKVPAEIKQAASNEAHQPTIEQLENAIRDLNQSMKENNSNLAFSIDKETQQTVVKVMDAKTGEMIKQFPSKEAIALAKAIGEVQQGLLLKQQA
ncbi:MAG: flagellar protein FlaG [Gallionellaceae bacterium]|jgi:flagellar protein FlaG